LFELARNGLLDGPFIPGYAGNSYEFPQKIGDLIFLFLNPLNGTV
jgi:hypothetical protein